jgi:hypothetical protein
LRKRKAKLAKMIPDNWGVDKNGKVKRIGVVGEWNDGRME